MKESEKMLALDTRPFPSKVLKLSFKVPNRNDESHGKGLVISRSFLRKERVKKEKPVLNLTFRNRSVPKQELGSPDKTKSLPKNVIDIKPGPHDNEVTKYFYYLEGNQRVSPDYLRNQSKITSEHRTKLVNWMSSVQVSQKLPTIVFTTGVTLLDSYLSKTELNLTPRELQIVGTAIIFLATKLEVDDVDIYIPEQYQFILEAKSVNKSLESFNSTELDKWEVKILRTLDFQVTKQVNPTHFLHRFMLAGELDVKTKCLATYLIELSFLDVTFLKYMPSRIAAAAVYLTRLMFTKTPFWTSSLVYWSGYHSEELRGCVWDLAQNLRKYGRTDQEYIKIRDKYNNKKNCWVAKMKHPNLPQVFKQPRDSN